MTFDGAVCLYLIWVLNTGTRSDILNKPIQFLPVVTGEEGTIPVWRRTTVLKIN